MNNKALTSINKRLEDHRLWLERNSSFGLNAVQETQTASRDPMLYSLLFMANSMDALGSFYGTRGMANFQERESASHSFSGAIEAYIWSVRLRFKFYYRLFEPDRPSRRSMFLHRLPLAVCLLCYFISTRDKQGEQEIWSLLKKSLLDRDKRVMEWWRDRHFEPFFVLLYSRVIGETIPLEAPTCDLGAYDSINNNWDNPEFLVNALRDACDYHLNHMENTRSWDAEFDLSPFDLIPFEIHALGILRKSNQFPPIEINHPLVNFIEPFGQRDMSLSPFSNH